MIVILGTLMGKIAREETTKVHVHATMDHIRCPILISTSIHFITPYEKIHCSLRHMSTHELFPMCQRPISIGRYVESRAASVDIIDRADCLSNFVQISSGTFAPALFPKYWIQMGTQATYQVDSN